MNADDIRRLFPNSSDSLLAANSGAAAKSQRAARNAALGQTQAEAGDRQRFLVRITSTRKRLLDEDNLIAKYHTDLCRYAGIIPSDAPGICKIETRQRKAAKGEEEIVSIDVYYID